MGQSVQLVTISYMLGYTCVVSYSPSGQVGSSLRICYHVRTRGRASVQGQVQAVGRGLGGSCLRVGGVIYLGRALLCGMRREASEG